MEFIPFQRKHLAQVLDLANNTLGNHYLTTTALTQHINSSRYLAFVFISNNKVAGFTSLAILTPTQLKKTVLKDKDWFYKISKEHANIAFRKQTIINPHFINKGIGTKLVQLSSEAIDSLYGLQLSTVWKKESNNAMCKLLVKDGFECAKTIHNYWEDNSLKKNYSCLVCGTPPCRCSAEVYIKKNASE